MKEMTLRHDSDHSPLVGRKTAFCLLSALTMFGMVLLSCAGALAADVRDGLVLEFRFEKLDQGQVVDSSSSGIKGIRLGNQVPPFQALSLSGHGKAMEFSGDQGQFVYVADADPLDISRFTISSWVYLLPKVHDQRWEVMEKAGAYWMNVRTDTRKVRTGAFLVACDGQAGSRWVYTDSESAITPNQWTHLAATYDGSNFKIYINGTLDKTYAATGDVCRNNDVVAVGAKYKPSRDIREAFWDGKLDDFRIYNRALSASEIMSIKNHVPPLP